MNPPHPVRTVWFPEWSAALAQRRLPAAERRQHQGALLSYLRYCQETRQPATVASARAFMEAAQAQGRVGAGQVEVWKAAHAGNLSIESGVPEGGVVWAEVPTAARRGGRGVESGRREQPEE